MPRYREVLNQQTWSTTLAGGTGPKARECCDEIFREGESGGIYLPDIPDAQRLGSHVISVRGGLGHLGPFINDEWLGLTTDGRVIKHHFRNALHGGKVVHDVEQIALHDRA